MEKARNLVSPKNLNPIFNPHRLNYNTRFLRLLPQTSHITASSKRKDYLSPQVEKISSKAPRRLIKISTSDGKWHGKWSSDYLLTLQDLRLQDLIEVDEDDHQHKDAQVFINLIVQKIDTQFNVWVLSTSRDNRKIQLPDIGGDDPSVIYVKPGYEADLDSLIQDTIRLTASVKDTCSDTCEKSEPTFQYTAGQTAASIDKRWSRLLELRNVKS
ncbi:DUF177 domain protein [Quillaja saponaria]|uniref:DUF177 domain protein n=1 Tax=Quillaja saponaria TaxID=32244 RepID=A0AAD7LAM5_QUISA|nr:DUF177 domain protein [Quillaja saponaria]